MRAGLVSRNFLKVVGRRRAMAGSRQAWRAGRVVMCARARFAGMPGDRRGAEKRRRAQGAPAARPGATGRSACLLLDLLPPRSMSLPAPSTVLQPAVMPATAMTSTIQIRCAIAVLLVVFICRCPTCRNASWLRPGRRPWRRRTWPRTSSGHVVVRVLARLGRVVVGLGLLLAGLGLRLGHVLVGARLFQAKILESPLRASHCFWRRRSARRSGPGTWWCLAHGPAPARRPAPGPAQGGVSVVLHDR